MCGPVYCCCNIDPLVYLWFIANVHYATNLAVLFECYCNSTISSFGSPTTSPNNDTVRASLLYTLYALPTMYTS